MVGHQESCLCQQQMQAESVYQCASAKSPEQCEHLQQEYICIIVKSNKYQIHLFQQKKKYSFGNQNRIETKTQVWSSGLHLSEKIIRLLSPKPTRNMDMTKNEIISQLQEWANGYVACDSVKMMAK